MLLCRGSCIGCCAADLRTQEFKKVQYSKKVAKRCGVLYAVCVMCVCVCVCTCACAC
jgi:hypothetical protein